MTNFTIHVNWNIIELAKLKIENDDEDKGQLQIKNKVRTDASHSYGQSVCISS